jgi:hypothetical protein
MKKVISIPKPCSEEWNNMSPNEKGKFCLSCQKNVLDLTQQSDVEILKILSENMENICGRARTEQLNRPLKPQSLSKNWPKWSFIAGFFTLMQPKNAQSEPKINADSAVIYPTKKTSIEPKTNLSLPIIKGVILDSSSLIALAGMSIYIEGSESGTVSDEKGNFELILNKPTQDLKEIKIVVQAVGYITQTIQLTENELNQKEIFLSIKMKEEILQEVVVIGGAICVKETPNMLDKIKKAFRTLNFRYVFRDK